MRPSRPAPAPAPLSTLGAATRIGRDLCRSAYWDRDGRFCNWMGRSPGEVTEPGGPITPTSMALGPDLYGGSSGVALFLAELFARTHEPQARRTALGAIGRSIRAMERLPAGTESPLSLFGGSLGVALAAYRVGVLTDAPEFSGAIERFGRAAAAVETSHMLDVVGGSAGAIPALLALRKAPGGERTEEIAVALGEELCRTATRNGEVWSWAPERASGPGIGTTPLTGFAHGASGIAWALLELHAATGRAEFLDAAAGAFAYEDSVFNPQLKNWPDLRSGSSDAPAPSTPSYATAWCHGAPGIALARLRAITLDPDRADAHRAAARAAVATTRSAIESTLAQGGRSDATYCHGLSGLTEVVLIAGWLLDDADARALNFAREIGRTLIERHSEAGDWPSGVGSAGPNPSLMLGTAGVGYEFLRLHDPEGVPPVLLIPTSI